MKTDRGSISILIATLSVCLGVVGLVGLAVAEVVAARAIAQNAADAAALAAAPLTFLGGPDQPWSAADRLATANGARVLSCQCPIDRSWSSRVVRVEVAVGVEVVMVGRRLVRAEAAAEFDPVEALAPR